jgi:hypothetical protein
MTTSEQKFLEWIDALEERHLSVLTPAEVARALRSLSSCYVERRDKLAAGDALGTAGKRAAFALFYAPIHFLVTRAVVRGLGAGGVRRVVDLGCGTGAAGAAWALDADASVTGVDRHPWVIAEASWTYRTLGLRGTARRGDVVRLRFRTEPGTAVIAAYTVNELSQDGRGRLLPNLLEAGRRGARILVLEPIARRPVPWWAEWQASFERAGGRSDEWRFPSALPVRQAQLARAAGLNPKALTARSLFL